MHRPARALLTIALALSGVACKPSPPAERPFTPAATMKTLMSGIIEPGAEVYWDAVGEVEDSTGVHKLAPATDEQWLAVRNGALTVAESGNLLMIPGRIVGDTTEWLTLAKRMIDAGHKAAQAADKHDTQGVFDAGAVLYDTCVACHSKYALQTQRPAPRN